VSSRRGSEPGAISFSEQSSVNQNLTTESPWAARDCSGNPFCPPAADKKIEAESPVFLREQKNAPKTLHSSNFTPPSVIAFFRVPL
jgi:hypothetical protein